MSRTLMMLALVATASACSGPPPAKAEGSLSDVLAQIYRDATPTDEATEEALIGALLRLDEDEFPKIDLGGDLNSRTVEPGKLTADFRAGKTLPAGMTGKKLKDCEADPPDEDCAEVSEDNQLPVAVFGLSKHAFAKHLDLVADDNQACIGSNSTKYSGKTWDDNKACFLDGSCDTTYSLSENYTKSIIADVWLEIHNDYFRTKLPDDREVMVSRGWTEKVWWSNACSQSWDQRFTIDIWIPDPNDATKTRRLYAMWSSVNITGVNEDFYVKLVKEGTDEGFENGDAFLDGEVCNWRDTEYSRADDVDAECLDGGGAGS